MGLWKKGFFRFGRAPRKPVSSTPSIQQQTEHVCHIEALEPRRLLAFSVLPIHLGMVYGEYATNDDWTGNRFELTWTGGEPATQLTQLVLNTDKDGQGLSAGDCFFDTAPGGRGVYGSKAFEVIENHGIDDIFVEVEDGGTVLRLSFVGFDPGDRLVFLIDVDEALPDNSKAEGAEFEGTSLTATFVAPHYEEAVATTQFVDAYGTIGASFGLSLPPDDVLPGAVESSADLTAGAFFQTHQTPLPIHISGRVFEDGNMNNSLDPAETGIAGVELALWRKEADTYLDTGLRATTDVLGNYRFEATPEVPLEPGVYRIVQTQPDGYLSVGAQPGHVGSEVRGFAEGPNVISEIQLLGGEDSLENNFGEVRPASISGRVYAERNLDGLWQPDEPLLPGTTLHLLDAEGHILATTQTDALGQYRFDGLLPGTYAIQEIQPVGYFDGADYVGSAGGMLVGPDTISSIALGSGLQAVHYDFTEIIPNSLSGLVYADMNQDGIFTHEEPLLAGVRIDLLDADGHLLQTTLTDATGQYRFDQLRPGVYTVQETQPADYLDGPEQIGSVGGRLVLPDTITDIRLVSGTGATEYNFGEILPGRISGSVFQDGPTIILQYGQTLPPLAFLRDGQLTADDTPLAGVVVQLWRDGTLVATTTTDSEGSFQFTMLEPGTYTLRQIQPAGYLDSIDTAGSLGGVVQSATDTISEIPVSPGAYGTGYWFSEVAVQWLPPLPPPPTPPPENPPTVIPFEPTKEGPFMPPPGPPLPRSDELLALLGQPFVLPATAITGSAVLEEGGGVASTPTLAWHLSVLNGGQPRQNHETGAVTDTTAMPFTLVSQDAWNPARSMKTNQGRWILGDPATGATQELFFGQADTLPVVGDWNGDGKTELGFYVAGQWYLDVNGNGQWDETDLWAQLGTEGDQPVTGDWDGDGKTDIGIVGRSWPRDPLAAALEPGLPDAQNLPGAKPKNLPPSPEEATDGQRLLQRTLRGKVRTDLIDHVFLYGASQDRPVVGDWNGDGVATIGLFRDGRWQLDTNGNGRIDDEDQSFHFGQPGDLPVVGDWNGDGIDDLAIYRDGLWILDTDGDRQLTSADARIHTGPGIPVAGDWNGDGRDEPAVYQPGIGPPRGT